MDWRQVDSFNTWSIWVRSSSAKSTKRTPKSRTLSCICSTQQTRPLHSTAGVPGRTSSRTKAKSPLRTLRIVANRAPSIDRSIERIAWMDRSSRNSSHAQSDTGWRLCRLLYFRFTSILLTPKGTKGFRKRRNGAIALPIEHWRLCCTPIKIESFSHTTSSIKNPAYAYLTIRSSRYSFY